VAGGGDGVGVASAAAAFAGLAEREIRATAIGIKMPKRLLLGSLNGIFGDRIEMLLMLLGVLEEASSLLARSTFKPIKPMLRQKVVVLMGGDPCLSTNRIAVVSSE
jgi:hypothetical protein